VDGHEEIVDFLEGNASFPDGGDAIEYIAELFNVCDGANALRDSQRNVKILKAVSFVYMSADLHQSKFRFRAIFRDFWSWSSQNHFLGIAFFRTF
jgi:hypothetical protein